MPCEPFLLGVGMVFNLLIWGERTSRGHASAPGASLDGWSEPIARTLHHSLAHESEGHTVLVDNLCKEGQGGGRWTPRGQGGGGERGGKRAYARNRYHLSNWRFNLGLYKCHFQAFGTIKIVKVLFGFFLFLGKRKSLRDTGQNAPQCSVL